MKTTKAAEKWPFENSGYLSGKQLFDILLLKKRNELEETMNKTGSGEVTLKELEKMYRNFLSESVLGLSKEERMFLTGESDSYDRKAGILSSIIELTGWRIRIGSFCSSDGYYGVEASVDGKRFKKLVFLSPEGDEETERIIRILSIEETGKEISRSCFETAGEHFRAKRPCVGKWGMEISGKKGRMSEKHNF